MPFFPEIDEAKTKENAKKILRGYPRWRRIAGDSVHQKVTATYSFEPRQAHGTPTKAVETLALNKVSADAELDAIEQAVSRLFDPLQRRVLFDKFLANMPEKDYIIYTSIGMSETLFYDTLDAALLAFAEQYREGEQVHIICGESAEKKARSVGG